MKRKLRSLDKDICFASFGRFPFFCFPFLMQNINFSPKFRFFCEDTSLKECFIKVDMIILFVCGGPEVSTQPFVIKNYFYI